MTPGTAYGRKMASRANRVSRARAVSRRSANSRARSTVAGTVIAPTRSIRSRLCHSSVSWITVE